ncbi:MAG TPA: cobalamin-independent methionine synthase II family protein [Candidatus Binataceae bacterium]|nr:cobalamin-independent methionine synthase II family protein [Candidatus Binataceae bacterium]
MKRSDHRILTTHTGSLPRPADLLAMIDEREAGALHDRAQLERRIAAAVAETVKHEAEIGIDVINDGEMGKVGYSTYPKDRLTGFEGPLAPAGGHLESDVADFPGFIQSFLSAQGRPVTGLKRPQCNGPISYRNRDELEGDLKNFKDALVGVKAEETFMTAASPGVIAFFLGNTYYQSHEAYLAALADAMKVEYEAIYRAGFILQLDCPDLAAGHHVQFSDARLDGFRRNPELHIEALNHAVAGIPPERVRLHLCWGNYEGPHHRDIALAKIIDAVYRARPAGISYEASNPRHEHEWTVFKDHKLPDGKVLIPGVIDSVSNFIEHPELVAQRICNLARVVGRENVIAGTDCGFGTFAGSSAVDPDIAWHKLRALVEGAQIATGELW